MLQVKDISKQFNSGGRTVTPLKNIDITIPEGSFSSIIGKSGSGKTTLLSLLGALDLPSSGKIVIGDTDITNMTQKNLSAYRLKDIGFIFQQYNLIANLTSLENVMLPLEFAKVPLLERKRRALELLAQVELNREKHNRKVNKLSGGEQQRVAIARALANNPKIILADEPTGNLDEETGEKIINLLESVSILHKTTIILVTHDRDIAKKAQLSFVLKNKTLSTIK